MNIILSGYGKMGREVESTALQRGHVILSKFDQPDEWELLGSMADKKPIVIDFSQPSAVYENILRCFQFHIPVVVGTTGWNEQLPQAVEKCRKEGQALLTASNFSIGMNIFFALNKYLADLMDQQESYDVSISETHHIHKLDKPSGTAITLAEQLLNNLKRKEKWQPGTGGGISTIGIESFREGEVFGDHSVTYDSSVDRIVISHSAKNRKGFALGAVLAAEWLKDKKGYFEMSDFLGI